VPSNEPISTSTDPSDPVRGAGARSARQGAEDRNTAAGEQIAQPIVTGVAACARDHRAVQVTFLGTSSGVPTRARNVSAVALRLPQRSELWLFDCGEGTQHQFLRSELRVSQLRRIFISHMHGDHVFGLPGLLASMGLAGTCHGIDLYGPDPLRDYLEGVLRTSSTRIGYPLRSHRVRQTAATAGVLLDDGDILVRCTALTHRIPAYAYRVDQKPRPGRFDVELARGLGIPPGPVYAELKAGRTVTLADGRIINGASLCGPERPGASVVICTDTVFCEAAVELAHGADLLIHESTFSHGEAELAIARQHSTSTMAAQTALEAGVKQLVLTHLSPRYMPGNPTTPDDLLSEARAIFRNTRLAHDFLSIDVLPAETA
jgi:ribonuclease Z